MRALHMTLFVGASDRDTVAERMVNHLIQSGDQLVLMSFFVSLA